MEIKKRSPPRLLRSALSWLAVFWNVGASAAGFSWPESHADYWVLSVAWSPEYCHDHAGSKEPQCTEEQYFAAEALHPQYRGDPPADCNADQQLPEDLISH